MEYLFNEGIIDCKKNISVRNKCYTNIVYSCFYSKLRNILAKSVFEKQKFVFCTDYFLYTRKVIFKLQNLIQSKDYKK